HPLDDGVRSWRASRHEHVDRNVLAQRPIQRTTINKYVGSRRAGTNRDDSFGSTDLAINSLNCANGILRDRSGDAEDVRMPGTAFETNAKLLGIVTRRRCSHNLDVASVTASGVQMEEPWAASPAVAHQAIPELHRRPHSSSVKRFGQTPAI